LADEFDVRVVRFSSTALTIRNFAMKATVFTSVLVVVALVSTHMVMAQSHATSPPPATSAATLYDHASTLEEGMFRGGADLMRSVGEANYNNALAAIHGQEAYNAYLDNRLKAATTYFDLRQINRERREEERGQRPTTETLARLARDRAPDRLAAHQFDATGVGLAWPPVFNDPGFAANREAIDVLMEHRGATAESQEVQKIAATMTENLRGRVHELKPMEYVQAKRFLSNLQYEMNFAPGMTAVAFR
jgi:hypothetical protein